MKKNGGMRISKELPKQEESKSQEIPVIQPEKEDQQNE